MNKQKILLLTDTIAPYRIPVFNLIAEDKTLDFTVLSLTKNMLGREWRLDEKKIKFKCRILNNIQLPIPLSNRLPIVVNFDLKAGLGDLDTDLIIITGYYQPTFLKALLYYKKKDIKVICWVESNLRSTRLNDFFSYRYKRWFLNMCDAFIVPGMRSRKFLLALKINENRIFIAPNAVDNTYYYVDLKEKYPNRRKMPEFQKYPQKNFLYVGRLLKEKGIQTLLKAYKEANLGSNVGLILVGNGKDQGYFKNLSIKLKLKNIFFEGFKQPEQLKNYYRLADIFVFPSLRDEWGMVLNEAAVGGLPIITSDEAGASDTLVSNKNGWIYRKNNTKELCTCLGNILLPENELVKKGIESQRIAMRHSPQKCASSILGSINATLGIKIYEDITNCKFCF